MTDDHAKRRGRQEKSKGYEMPFLKMVLLGDFLQLHQKLRRLEERGFKFTQCVRHGV